jgi:DNA-binding LacI/PurR family transcriptional regulator
MGEQAARLLIQLINGEPPAAKSQNIVLPPELVVRSSCGAKPLPRAGVGSAARRALHP